MTRRGLEKSREIVSRVFGNSGKQWLDHRYLRANVKLELGYTFNFRRERTNSEDNELADLIINSLVEARKLKRDGKMYKLL
ncbi:MAG: hypothetical protein LUC86_03290 [Prevotellaceae bacterium]|nr:hypothetical protein [Prevotellaceae bacterium]